jgi:hypothetical protein
MKDGTLIAADVLLPADLPPGTKLPALMIMARYWRSMDLRMPSPPKRAPIGPRENAVDYFISRGFAVVVIDVRGAGASTGVNRFPWAPEEISDYGETAKWILDQPWNNGAVGAYGISYEGAAAQRLASLGIPGVKAVIPQEIEFDVYADVALPGGLFNKAFIKAWNDSNTDLDRGRPSSLFPWFARLLIKGVRPVDDDRRTGTVLRRALADHERNTDVFKALEKIVYRDDCFGDTGARLDDFSIFAHSEEIEKSGVPMFSWGSWLDGASAEAALRNLNTYGNPQIVVIGAWKHEMTAHGSPYGKPGARPDPVKEERWAAMAGFFQRTLVAGRPPTGNILYYYTLGEEAWKKADSFPPRNTVSEPWYLSPGRSLSPTPPGTSGEDTGAGTESGTGKDFDLYKVDFAASTGTKNRWHTQMARPLVYPDRRREDRKLLTYTSEPLDRNIEITGYPVAVLYVESNMRGGAFFVYLEDVDPAGKVRYITEGMLRGIHRKISDTDPPYKTGMPYHSCLRRDAADLPRGEYAELVLGLQPTSVLIRWGHRIRVALAGADMETFVRVPEEGNPVWKVSRTGPRASRLILPVVK